MSTSTLLTLVSLAIVALVLARDWGHRKVTLFALLRPLVAFVIIPFVAPGWNLSGAGLPLEIGGLLVGTALGLMTMTVMKVGVDSSGQAWTDAGVPYATIWIAIAAARLLLIYGSQHWFTQDLGMFLMSNHISVNAFADSIIFLAIAPVIANRLGILVRVRANTAAQRTSAPVAS